MTLEYLTKDNQIDKITDEKFTDVHHECYQLKESDSWVSLFALDSNSEDTAILLSKLNIKIMDKYSPTVLTNESSQYFNKRLFPLLNDFERKLRKLLYLYNSLNPSVKGGENIKNIENLDFGTIFKHLFTDDLFYKYLKKQINDVADKLTKKEIIDMVAKMEEKTLWSELIGNDRVSHLVEQPSQVRSMRNSVMHAHNIDHIDYKKSKKLVDKINRELDVEIGTLTGKEQVAEEVVERAIKVSDTWHDLFESIKCYDSYHLDLATILNLQETVYGSIPQTLSSPESAILLNDIILNCQKMNENYQKYASINPEAINAARKVLEASNNKSDN